jgi:hypothetical protein
MDPTSASPYKTMSRSILQDSWSSSDEEINNNNTTDDFFQWNLYVIENNHRNQNEHSVIFLLLLHATFTGLIAALLLGHILKNFA